MQSWLASVALRAGPTGWSASSASASSSPLLAGAIAGITWTLTRPARGLVARLAITGVGLAIGATMWAPRPLMFGLVLLGITLLVAERRLPAPVLLPVFWIWVNTHGSFPLGLVALGAYALGSAPRRRAATDRGSRLSCGRWAAPSSARSTPSAPCS